MKIDFYFIEKASSILIYSDLVLLSSRLFPLSTIAKFSEEAD